jgi:hypothetical protein
MEKIHIQVLPVGIPVDFHGLVQISCSREDSAPIRLKTEAIIVDPPARVTQDLDKRETAI